MNHGTISSYTRGKCRCSECVRANSVYQKQYNVKDVVLLEKVFEALRPYAKQLTRLTEATSQDEFACPSCGSQNLQKRGLYRTQSSTYQRYECKSCGRYSRSRAAEKTRFAVHPL